MKIIKDNNTLRNNHMYVAALAEYADGTTAIITDEYYDSLPRLVKKFIIAHEMGHANKQPNETVADKYAMSKVGKIKTQIAMLYMFNKFLSIDWTVSAQYLVRMSNLGFKVNHVKIKAPNGNLFSVDDIRPYMNDNYKEL